MAGDFEMTLALLLANEGEWTPADVGESLLIQLGRFGPWVAVIALVALLLRAWWRRERYRAVVVLDEAAQADVRAAVRAAETRTVGEVVPVIVERSDRHPGARWGAALAALLLGSLLLIDILPWTSPILLLLCQLGLGALGALLAAFLPDVQRTFISERRATEVAEEQALQEFVTQGLQETVGRTGVLVFVSLLERRVVVLADEGIASDVADDAWVPVDRAVLAGIRAGSLRTGLIDALQLVGDILAGHAPGTPDDENELADRVVVRRE